jgi:hypothetical protein
MKVVWTSYYLMDSSILEKRIILFIIEWLVTLLIIVLGKKNDEFLFLFGKGKQFKRMMKKMLRRMRCYE